VRRPRRPRRPCDTCGRTLDPEELGAPRCRRCGGRSVNRRLATTEPWRLPDPAAHHELTRLLPLLDALAVAAWPFVPDTAARSRALLGRPPAPDGWTLDERPPRVPAAPAPPLPRPAPTP
jgi:methionyl-tRNA synthetase